ncbi:MAG: PrgI family protein [Candidatus Staskawiczbacteria bacterium]|nr:PrgI family protein [Candidatus Staskawiczbacteria bacterium]
MGYEIPQSLEYKEKIMFGLNFKQLVYLFIFAPIVSVIFFKTNLHIAIKIPIISTLSGLAIGFIFLNLDKHVKNWYYWYRSKIIQLPHKLEEFIPIKKIEEDLVFTKDNRKLAILRIIPINFSIKPEESKQAIAIAFQKFLNSLDFPIQIIMSTEKLNLQDYFNEFKQRIRNSERFNILFESYKKHLESLTKENEVMNRVFYLVIQERSDINIQLQICQAKLTNVGLKSVRLKKDELNQLLKNFFIAQPKTKEVKDVSKKEKTKN